MCSREGAPEAKRTASARAWRCESGKLIIAAGAELANDGGSEVCPEGWAVLLDPYHHLLPSGAESAPSQGTQSSSERKTKPSSRKTSLNAPSHNKHLPDMQMSKL